MRRLMSGLLLLLVLAPGCLADFVASPDGGDSPDLAQAGLSPDLAATAGNPTDLARSRHDFANAGGPTDLAGGPTDLAGGPTDLAGGPAGAPDLAISSACLPLTAAVTDGHHNPGTACMPCHDGNTATLWTAAGTLYNATTGGTTLAGASIVLTDANNKLVRIVTSANGNFYTGTPLTMPVVARASGCPNDVSMVSKATGNCNMAGCHDSTLRIHLP